MNSATMPDGQIRTKPGDRELLTATFTREKKQKSSTTHETVGRRTK